MVDTLSDSNSSPYWNYELEALKLEVKDYSDLI